MLYILERGVGVPCPPLPVVVGPPCALSVHVCATIWLLLSSFLFLYRLRPSYLMCLRVWVGLRLCLVWVSIGVLTWTGWARRLPPTAGVWRWSFAPVPRTHGYTCLWPAPKWWKSYSWPIRMSCSRDAATLLRGLCLYFSGYLPPPHPVAHKQRWRGAKISTLIKACLQVHLLLFPIYLLKTLLWFLCWMVLSVSVHDTHVINTASPILPEVTGQ